MHEPYEREKISKALVMCEDMQVADLYSVDARKLD